MPKSFQIDIVSTEREIYSGQVSMAFVFAELGEVGIAPGHAPMITRLAPGELRVRDLEGHETGFYISGGLLEVQPDCVTVLSDTAQRAEDLDEAAALKAQEEAINAMHDKQGTMDYAKARAALAEAAAQLQAIQRLRKRN